MIFLAFSTLPDDSGDREMGYTSVQISGEEATGQHFSQEYYPAWLNISMQTTTPDKGISPMKRLISVSLRVMQATDTIRHNTNINIPEAQVIPSQTPAEEQYKSVLLFNHMFVAGITLRKICIANHMMVPPHIDSSTVTSLPVNKCTIIPHHINAVSL